IVPSLALPAPQESLEPLLLVTELRDRLVVLSPGRGDDDVARVVAAVRRRRPPTPAMLARWVARRLSTRELEAPLRHQFERGLGVGARGGAAYGALRAHSLTPACRRGISLSELATPAATKANPAKAGGTKPRVLASSATPA